MEFIKTKNFCSSKSSIKALSSRLHIHGSGSGAHGSVADMQFCVFAQELHTLEVTGQETVAQIKAHVASLEGIPQVVLLAGASSS